jgi:hypothetical protein
MYESNGPEVKIRGSASHVAEKYLQLARDAQSSGDPVAAENFYQHAEHYFRLIAAAQEQFRQNNPYYQPQQQQQNAQGGGNSGEDGEDGEDDDQPTMGGEPYAPQPQQNFYQQQRPQHQPQHQQPYPPREPQPSFNPRDGQQRDGQQQHHQQQQQQQNRPQQPQNDGDVDRLPSFITGGGQPQQQPQQGNGSNGYDNQGGGGDRFPLHRRRRRHHGPREQSVSGDADTSSPNGPGSTNE